MTDFIQRLGRSESIGTLLVSLAIAGCTGNLSGGGGAGSTDHPPGGGLGPAGGGMSGSNTPNNGAPATDPGRVTMHRLNLAEYDNTMRDLLDTKKVSSVEYKFPPDDRGADFDNASDVLTVSTLHVSGYDTAATALIAEALGSPTARAKLVSCDLAAQGSTCARSALEAFLPRAWRREVTAAEVDSFMPLVTLATTQADTAEVGFRLALRAALLSPNFIYRPEIDPMPASLAPHPLGEYELASRVSYFLWSSMPDAGLFAAAKAGNLHDPATLSSQVKRMLTDPKSQALIDNFAGQWLFIRLFDDVAPDPGMFPKFDAGLRSAFKTETASLFHEFAFNGMPADQLLTANFTFANNQLAQFYGLPAVTGATSQRIDLSANPQRRGLLTQGGLLMANSHPNMTSPVKRGKFVIEQLLCQSVPPPPANVKTALEPDRTGVKTLRQTLESHLLNPTCASCHTLMDPLGFSMENYDAIGAYRTIDNTLPIDATVRALEMQLSSAGSTASCMKGTAPPTKVADFQTHVKLMLDVMVMAFQCDATRVITFMLGNAGSNQSYPFLMANGAPITGAHHEISHHGSNPTNIAQLIAINTWTFEQIGYLLDKLKAVPDGAAGENLLTNSAIVVSSDISDGNMHNHTDMPVLLAGHGGGALKPGQHVRYGAPIAAGSYKTKPASSGVPLANLMLTTVATLGVTGTPVGDSTATLQEV